MIQKQKGFSAPVLALSVWTAALAEEMQTGISPRGMIIHGAVQALLLTCISGGVLCLLAAGSHAVDLAVFRRSMVSGRVV